MALHLVLDFDDTLLENSLTYGLFERFCAGRWQECLLEYHEGRLSVEQCNAEALKLVDAEESTIRDFARQTALVRAGLEELVDTCRRLHVHSSVLSNSFDLLIDPVLQQTGFRVPRHCGIVRHRYVWQVSYTDTTGYPVYSGFKEVWARAFLRAGDSVLYCGDGASDIPAAGLASFVFARDTLLRHCQDAGLRHLPFNTFRDIAHALPDVLEDLAAITSGRRT